MTAVRQIGFIGVGTMAAALVRGLAARHGGGIAIHLSPRSEALSRTLAAELPEVVRADSNADVLARSGMVVIAVRPQELDAALSGLSFRPDHLVVSLAATVPVAEIARIAAPAERVCRLTPLPAVARGRGPIVLYPRLPDVAEIFQELGDLIVAEDEAAIMGFGCASALMSTFFETQGRIAGWLARQGVPAAQASLYVRSMQDALAGTGLAAGERSASELATAHETPRGLNERARLLLQAAGHFDLLDRALDDIAGQALRPPAK
jgi:pyrroline-5-carboxylate reductase